MIGMNTSAVVVLATKPEIKLTMTRIMVIKRKGLINSNRVFSKISLNPTSKRHPITTYRDNKKLIPKN